MPDPGHITPASIRANEITAASIHAAAHRSQDTLTGAEAHLPPERVIEAAIGLYDGPRTGKDAPPRMAKAVLAALAEHGLAVVPAGHANKLASSHVSEHADLRRRMAEALAAKFIHQDLPPELDDTDFETAAADRQMWRSFIADDGERDYVAVTCNEAAQVCADVRDDKLVAALESIDDLNDLIRQERVIHIETIRRAEQAEAALNNIRVLANILTGMAQGLEATYGEAAARPIHTIQRELHSTLDGAGAVSEEQTEPVRHLGGNAEDCPACDLTTMTYPFLCPAEEQSGDRNG